MTIELYFSNQLEYLAEKLAQVLAKGYRRVDNPFLPLKIIVPNNNLAKWLTLMLARRESIVMNVDFLFLETGLWKMIATLDTSPQPAEMLSKTKARLLILFVLTQIKKDDPDLAPLVGYLFKSNGQKHPDYSIRLWQLSERLARLFQEYEYHRTDMVREWLNGRMESDDLARCEQCIYLAMIEARNAAVVTADGPILSLMEYADRILPTVIKMKDRPDDPERIHFFGLSQVSAFHLSVIDRLKPFYDIQIYALNPSREFWEDIRTPAEKHWVKSKKPGLSIRDEETHAGELFETQDHPLLAAWGKPGRESVRLLCQLTDYTFNAGFSPVDKIDTVLKQVQNDILTLGTQIPSTRLNQDHSLQIYGCPGVHREVETVYQNIIFNLSRDDHLQLTDIAVLVPDITVYKPVFNLVFNRSPRCLFYNLVDSRADIESVYGQAILELLSLATERFSRKTVFALILNPCLLYKWRIGPDDVRTWAKWAESLNIFHSFERIDQAPDNSPESGCYTWKQGLQRLRLSRIFSSDATQQTDAIHFKNLVPFADMDTGDTDLMEKFCLVVEALARVVDTLRMSRASAARWRTALLNISQELLSIPPDYKGEMTVRQSLFRSLDELTFFDRLRPPGDSSKLDATLVSEYLRFNLGAIAGGSGDYLTGGVTVSELQPMRPIPFKIIYVLGMEEGTFPGRVETTLLDLRLKKRRIGDISLPERNRYLFLETLLAAREKLYISFVSRDLQKDRVLQPCNVVSQLKRYLEESVIPVEESFQMGTVPLKGSSTRYLEPTTITSWSDVRVNYDLADRVACYRAAGIWPKARSRIGKSGYQRVAHLDPDLSIFTGASPDADRGDDQIQLWRLKQFLLQPLDESVQRHLGLFEEEIALEEFIQIEDEPFFSDYPMDWRLKFLPLHHWLDTIFTRVDPADVQWSLDRIFDHFYADYHRQSATPEGLFATVDKASLWEKLSGLETVITPLVDQMRSADESLAAIVIGTPGDLAGTVNGRNIVRVDPIAIPVSGQDPVGGQPISGHVRLHGQLRWFWREKETGWHVLVPTGIKSLGNKVSKYVIEPVLFYLFCLTGESTRDWIGKSPFTFHLVTAKKSYGFTFQAEKDEAVKYLSHLTSEYLDRQNRFWLPFETIVGCSVNPLVLNPSAIDESRRAHFKDEMIEAFSEKAGELDRLINPVFPNDLLDRAIDRFGIFGKLQPTTI